MCCPACWQTPCRWVSSWPVWSSATAGWMRQFYTPAHRHYRCCSPCGSDYVPAPIWVHRLMHCWKHVGSSFPSSSLWLKSLKMPEAWSRQCARWPSRLAWQAVSRCVTWKWCAALAWTGSGLPAPTWQVCQKGGALLVPLCLPAWHEPMLLPTHRCCCSSPCCCPGLELLDTDTLSRVLPALTASTSLTTVTFSSSTFRLTDAGVEVLSGLPHLKHLSIPCVDREDAPALQRLRAAAGPRLMLSLEGRALGQAPDMLAEWSAAVGL